MTTISIHPTPQHGQATKKGIGMITYRQTVEFSEGHFERELG